MHKLINPNQAVILTRHSLPDCEVAGTNAGIFPGAYKGRMLLNSSVNSNTFTPVTETDCYSALAQLQKAFETGFSAYYKSMPLAAMRVMSLEADGAEKIKVLEQVLIDIYESKFQIVRDFLASQPTITSLSYTQASTLCIKNALDCASLKEATQASTIENTTPENTSLAPIGAEIKASTGVLETAVTLIVKANVLESCWQNPAIDREMLRQLHEELTQEFKRFTGSCDSQLEKAGLMQASKFRLQQLSPRVRTINLIDGLKVLDRDNSDLLSRMHATYRQEPFCGPLVVITAANGRLFYNQGEKKAKIIPTVADDLMCRDASFLAINREGRISFVHMNYDYGWGRLGAGNAIDLNREFGRGFLPKEGAYDWTQLTAIVNLYPSLEFDRINKELADLKQDPEFETYLADKSQRYGPKMIKNKSWLDQHGGKHNPEMADFLASMYVRLIDSNRLQETAEQQPARPEALESQAMALSIQNNLKLDEKQFRWLSQMLANSYMSNMQGEHFLIHFLQKAIESGHTLRNFRLESYAEENASDWLRSLEKRGPASYWLGI